MFILDFGCGGQQADDDDWWGQKSQLVPALIFKFLGALVFRHNAPGRQPWLESCLWRVANSFDTAVIYMTYYDTVAPYSIKGDDLYCLYWHCANLHIWPNPNFKLADTNPIGLA